MTIARTRHTENMLALASSRTFGLDFRCLFVVMGSGQRDPCLSDGFYTLVFIYYDAMDCDLQTATT